MAEVSYKGNLMLFIVCGMNINEIFTMTKDVYQRILPLFWINCSFYDL